MLDSKQILEKLEELADLFRVHYRNKKWSQAKACYENARTVAVFLETSDNLKAKLFGNRPYIDDSEEIEDGLFPEELVQKVYKECILQNKTYENKPYLGQPKNLKSYSK